MNFKESDLHITTTFLVNQSQDRRMM